MPIDGILSDGDGHRSETYLVSSHKKELSFRSLLLMPTIDTVLDSLLSMEEGLDIAVVSDGGLNGFLFRLQAFEILAEV